ncbi:MAG: chemotaxis response regulator protein-glutamate methylesterase [Planctomycetaceae bacterium]|nr:chemotaxis response regulator protein-glutamate methylesterase [Planctomycetaceae bacterium]
MTSAPIRVLVVDDSAVMRQRLREWIESDPGMAVVATAGDGREALDQLAIHRPDVVTLDVQMPTMDGLTALDAIFARQPTPVVMVSSLTGSGAQTTLDALDRGAIDCVRKPDPLSPTHAVFRAELLQKIRTAARVDMRRLLAIRQQRKAPSTESHPAKPQTPIETDAADRLANLGVLVGISTGGPSALSVLFRSLRPPMPPIVVVQHMPRGFTAPLAARLDHLTPLSVREAASDDALQPNGVWIAPAGQHLRLHRIGRQIRVALDDAPPRSGHRPSIDVTMESAANTFGPRCIGVLMTGMGRDGVAGCAAIHQAGGRVLGQDEATSDIYGMNKAAQQAGWIDREVPLDLLASVLESEIRGLAAS